jgi:hypothetical protein
MEQAESEPLLTTEFVTQTVTIVKALPLKTKACFEESHRSLSLMVMPMKTNIKTPNQKATQRSDRK